MYYRLFCILWSWCWFISYSSCIVVPGITLCVRSFGISFCITVEMTSTWNLLALVTLVKQCTSEIVRSVDSVRRFRVDSTMCSAPPAINCAFSNNRCPLQKQDPEVSFFIIYHIYQWNCKFFIFLFASWKAHNAGQGGWSSWFYSLSYITLCSTVLLCIVSESTIICGILSFLSYIQ